MCIHVKRLLFSKYVNKIDLRRDFVYSYVDGDRSFPLSLLHCHSSRLFDHSHLAPDRSCGHGAHSEPTTL